MGGRYEKDAFGLVDAGDRISSERMERSTHTSRRCDRYSSHDRSGETFRKGPVGFRLSG